MRVEAGDVPDILRRCGVVGAGGAGFPTYVKYQHPTSIFIANGVESEPGYYGDKLLMHHRPDVIGRALILLRGIFDYADVVLAIKQRHLPYAAELVRMAEGTDAFRIETVGDAYRLGEEKALTKLVTGDRVPKGAIPPDVDVTVQNVETLHNIFWALTEHRGVTHKIVQTIGGHTHGRVIEAPIGAPVEAVWTHCGVDAGKLLAKERLIDGGPLLGQTVEAPLEHVVQRTTNGLLCVPGRDYKRRGRLFPGPEHEPPGRIEELVDQVDAVDVPLGGGHCKDAEPVVEEGDEVAAGQEIGRFLPDALSVSAHASIPGIVAEVGGGRIRIERA